MALKYLYVPSGYKAGKAYGVLPNVANADLSFVRGSAGTRVNADGLLESEVTDVPRLDYTDGSCPTLLTEPERENIAQYSEQIDSWGKNPNDGTVTVRANEEASPDGNITADVVSVLTQFDGIYTQGITTVAESTYSCSTYVRHVAGSSKIRVGITENFHSSTGSKYIVVDLSNGSIILNEVSSFATAKVINAGNDWYRIIIENITVPVGVGGNSNFVVYSYEDTFTEFSVWGGQIEVGNYASSYIPNLSNSTTTRSADTGVVSGDLSSYINSSEGVLEIKAKTLFNGGNDVRIGISDGTSDNRISLVYGTGADSMVLFMKANGQQVLDGGTVDFKILTGSFPQTNTTTFKIKWKSGDLQVKVNDTTIALSQTDTFTMVGLDQVRLDGGVGSNIFEGNIQYIKVYDSATDF
jgi:hypothetical protein